MLILSTQCNSKPNKLLFITFCLFEYFSAWSAEETSSVKTYFKNFIEDHNYPSGEQIKKFIDEKKFNRTVSVIRAKLQHLINQTNTQRR